MQSGGARVPTTDLLINGRPTLPPEPQSPLIALGCIQACKKKGSKIFLPTLYTLCLFVCLSDTRPYMHMP